LPSLAQGQALVSWLLQQAPVSWRPLQALLLASWLQPASWPWLLLLLPLLLARLLVSWLRMLQACRPASLVGVPPSLLLINASFPRGLPSPSRLTALGSQDGTPGT